MWGDAGQIGFLRKAVDKVSNFESNSVPQVEVQEVLLSRVELRRRSLRRVTLISRYLGILTVLDFVALFFGSHVVNQFLGNLFGWLTLLLMVGGGINTPIQFWMARKYRLALKSAGMPKDRFYKRIKIFTAVACVIAVGVYILLAFLIAASIQKG